MGPAGTPQVLDLHCSDGRQLQARWHAAGASRAVAVVAPALGVPRRYYDAFAAYLAQRGIAVLTFDYRGVADNEGGAQQDQGICLSQWGQLDLSAAYAAARQRLPGLPLIHIGHSCGTQLIGLAEGCAAVDAALLVAATAPNAAHWPGWQRWAIALMWRVLVPLLAAGRLRFPARRLGISSVDVPAGVMRQWAQWGLSPHYLFSPKHGLPLAAYGSLRCPALVLELSDDAFAPTASVDALLQQMPALKSERRRIAPADVGARAIGHMGFFHKRHLPDLWSQAADWMLAAVGHRP